MKEGVTIKSKTKRERVTVTKDMSQPDLKPMVSKLDILNKYRKNSINNQ